MMWTNWNAVMTRNGQKPQYELWCQHTTNSNNIAGKTFCINAVMMALLLLPPIGKYTQSPQTFLK